MKLRLTCALLAISIAAPGHAARPQSATPLASPAEWVNTSDYPAGALRRENEGITSFRLTIDPQGRVSACLVTVSSGWAALDDATCRLISERARFSPATDRKGRAVEGTYSNRVRWVIPKDQRNPQPGLVVFSALVAPDGTVSDCRIEKAEGGATAEVKVGPLAACPMPKVEHGYTDADGSPVYKLFRRTIRTELLTVPPPAPLKGAAPALPPCAQSRARLRSLNNSTL